MELLVSLITIAIIAVVLLLQVIALVQIAGMRKTIRELKETRTAPAPVPSNDRFERKGGDFRRHEKRPYQDQRPRPPAQHPQAPATPASPPAAAVDPVETSLRDINLRLKNAERDQENARRKIQENLGGERDHHQRGQDRGDRYRDRDNGDRDRNRGGRDGNRDGRGDRNRNPRRDNWQPQGNRQAPLQTQQAAAPVVPAESDEPAFERKEIVAVPPVEQMTPVSPVAQAEFVVAAPAAPTEGGSGDEGFEHGRKVFVKRRPLSEDGSEVSDSPAMAKEKAAFDATEGAETEIQFGRRKGL